MIKEMPTDMFTNQEVLFFLAIGFCCVLNYQKKHKELNFFQTTSRSHRCHNTITPGIERSTSGYPIG